MPLGFDQNVIEEVISLLSCFVLFMFVYITK